MSLKIEQGLFNLDFIDYHAILGIPVDADVKDIRKRYLTIARRLHPDSCMTENEADRQRAAEFLSKLVNPAYEKLSQERSYTEYCVLLRLKGQQALKQQDTVALTTDSSRRLASSGDLDNSYRVSVRDLAEKQYQSLDQSLDLIGQISELNLVYLMRKEGRRESVGQPKSPNPAVSATRSPAAPPSPPTKAPLTRESLLASYLRRSQEFETKQDFPRAIQELREALKMEPTNSDCHSRLGVIYLKTNQATMAKIHFNKALELNPQDAVALEGKRRLETPNSSGTTVGKSAAKVAKPDPKAKADPKGKSNSKGGKPDSKGNGGGLFGLFGGKKK
ncbi:MAG: DnaJ domain-containing protein [Cyanobacteria bacterium CRU_2_1]|nr:DnaJ domain-containing protein [Cyanobacteria bacterium RU_5_0]NJR59078.1 DnaJ domain-containing protein [Cyanobacteria bacterium CRU_2_1]